MRNHVIALLLVDNLISSVCTFFTSRWFQRPERYF